MWNREFSSKCMKEICKSFKDKMKIKNKLSEVKWNRVIN